MTKSNQKGLLNLSAKSYLFPILDWKTILLFLKYVFQNLAADFLLSQYWGPKLDSLQYPLYQYPLYCWFVSEKKRNKMPIPSHVIYNCILYRLKSRVMWKSPAWDDVHIIVIFFSKGTYTRFEIKKIMIFPLILKWLVSVFF